MKVTNNHGLTFADVILVVFIILKLCGVINWSWWWVLSPLWISLVIVGMVVILAAWRDWE